MKAFLLALSAGAAALILPGAASAADAGPLVATGSNFARDRNVTVSERPRPDYEAVGLPVGSFRLYPRLSVGVDYDANVFGQQTGEVSDVVSRLVPDISLQSDWSRHEFAGYVNARLSRYHDYTSENTDDVAVGVRTRVDISRAAAIHASVETARQTEERTSNNPVAQLTASPIRFDRQVANVEVTKEFNRLRILGRADYQKLDYDNALSALTPGLILLQDDRDRTLTAITGRAEYALSPATAFFVEGAHNDRDYRYNLGPDRSSRGYDVGAGVNFDLSRLMRGEFRVGYLSQDYRGAFQDISGLSVHARVDWLPTQLLTVNVAVDRSVEEATSVAAAGYLSTRIQTGFDYELLRNLIITGRIAYQDDDYRGIARQDDRTSAGLTARYFLNRSLAVQAGYSRLRQSSEGADRAANFTDQIVSVALILQR